MRGSRNFHESGSNENGNFWSQTSGGGGGGGGGVKPPNIPEITFFKVKFSNSRGVRTTAPPHVWIRAYMSLYTPETDCNTVLLLHALSFSVQGIWSQTFKCTLYKFVIFILLPFRIWSIKIFKPLYLSFFFTLTIIKPKKQPSFPCKF